MGLGLDLAVGGDDDDAVLDPQHLDGRAVEPRQHRAGHHLLDGAERRAAAPEIEHAVHRAEQRIELVGGEEHGDAERLLDALHQRHHRLLIAGIEADQRLVEQQQLGFARAAPAPAAAAAARRRRAVDAAARRAPWPPPSPAPRRPPAGPRRSAAAGPSGGRRTALATKSQPHSRRSASDGALLRQIAGARDCRASAPRRRRGSRPPPAAAAPAAPAAAWSCRSRWGRGRR